MKKKRIFTAVAFTFALVFSLFSPKVVSVAGFKERIHEKERIIVEKLLLSEDQLYELDWKNQRNKSRNDDFSCLL